MNNRFKRLEKKYYLTPQKYNSIIERLNGFIEEDKHHHNTIRNIYYDDDYYSVIRHSISKPVFKQKLRLRSYNGESIFFELKKKFNKVVYKRRIEMDITRFYESNYDEISDIHTLSEINYILTQTKVYPKLALQYKRDAYKSNDGLGLRLTFDYELKCSLEQLDIREVLTEQKDELDGNYIMEVKCNEVIPLWFSKILDDLEIYSSPFSKYGFYYKKYLSQECISHIEKRNLNV